ncbi:MAG: GGDEF domain-containing protein [Burkholderiaceae bacterium]
MMSQHTEDFQPKSYALWYAYVLGTHPALKSAIDKRISQGERLSDQATLDLYAHHLIEKAESQVADAQDKLMRVLAKAHDQMHSAGSETSRFNEHLLEFGTALGSPEDLDKLKAEVETMAGETSRIHATIDRLVDSVRESQAEVARLSLELTRARDQANTDALTGLANRRAFDDAILQFCRGHGSRGLCLIMMDIDHFKKVNDNYGHPYGDLVIKTVASIIHANVRGRDLAARYGGEEFAVLLLDTHESDAAMVADRIRDQVSLAAIRDVDGTQAKQITVSAGVAEHDSREPPEGLTGRADRALYRSKTGGRNRVTRASG